MIRLPAPNLTRCLLVSAGLMVLLSLLVAVIAPPKAWAAVNTIRVTATNLSNFDLPVNLSDLEPDVNANYRVGGSTVEVTDGYSLRQILDYAAADDDRLDYSNADSVTVGAIRVQASDISRPMQKPPVFFQTDEGMSFVRSETGNSSAARTSFSSDPLVSIRSRAESTSIPVDLTASARRIDEGDSVDLSASVTGVAGANLRYTWTFGDGSSDSTAKPSITHTFDRPGSFDVLLAVTDLSTGNQGADSVSIQVGKAEEEKETNEESDDAGGGSSTYVPPPDFGSGSFGPPGGSGSGFGTPGGSGVPGGTPAPPAVQAPEEPAEPVNDGLETISGELVSSTAPAATIDPSLPGGADALQEGAISSDGFLMPRGAWVAIGVLALFGFGLLAERRGSRLI